VNIKTNSRECQDIFIATLFKNKKNGHYIEIGSNHPIIDSNTYLLENKLNWKGISFEINNDFVNEFNNKRSNPCICCDATIIDYDHYFNLYKMPKDIDFLQLDIEPSYNTFKALKKINFGEYNFNFITFEHEFYREGDEVRQESRSYIQKMGYKLLIEDVMHDNKSFEDWYVNEKYFDEKLIQYLYGKNINMNLNNIEKKYYDFIITNKQFND
jgi:hypothetical protein